MSLYFNEEVKRKLLSNTDKQIVIYDDKKQKSESIEAYAVGSNITIDITAEGFGSTTDEALAALKQRLQSEIDKYQEFINLIDSKTNIIEI